MIVFARSATLGALVAGSNASLLFSKKTKGGRVHRVVLYESVFGLTIFQLADTVHEADLATLFGAGLHTEVEAIDGE